MKSKNKVNSNKPEIIPVPCTSHVVIKSNKKLNSLVYNYLVRNYHFDVAIEFHQLVGSLDDVRGGPLLEDMLTHYGMRPVKTNAEVIADKEKYLKIVKLNDEYHDHILNFQTIVGSQLDQVVQYLILQNQKTYNLGVKFLWYYLLHNRNDYQWISMRNFSTCKGGETEMMMKNYEELLSNARVNNPKKFCDEISDNLSAGQGKPISGNVKWKLIMIGVFLSKGLTKMRHPYDVLIRVMNDVKSKPFVKGVFLLEEDKIIVETVQKYGNNEETWEKLCKELNRSTKQTIKLRYELSLARNLKKGASSSEEDNLLIDCLFTNSSLKNPKYISSILTKNIKDSKADEKIGRDFPSINTHYQEFLKPLLLQYHLGTINTPWKYSVLQCIYENKVMSAIELKEHMTEINKTFPWLNINLASTCFKSTYNAEMPLYEHAKTLMEKYKDRPARTEKALKRCEEIIVYYDPRRELSEYKFCKIHDKCLKSHSCGSL